jgi:LysR family transcriptional regulator, transcriptional activator for bauABCD operon
MRAYVHDLDIRLLRVFQAVARQQGFSAAQDVLNSTQSAISMNMAQLESRLGMRLCSRGVKGFRLTEHGKEVLSASEKLFVAIDEFRSETERLKGNISGTLRIGMVDNISCSSDFTLPKVIMKLKQSYPDLGLDLFVGATEELEDRVSDGRIQAGIGLFHRQLPKLKYQSLFLEEHELYCGDDHPFFKAKERDLTDDLLLQANYVGREALENFQALTPPLPFQPVASSRYIEGLATLILSGRYIAYLPTHYAAIWKPRMRSIRPQQFGRRAAISLVFRRSRNLAPALDALITSVKEA